MPTSYPVDFTGFASTNLVANEPHVLTEQNSNTQRIIVPEFAPFYLDNLLIRYTDAQGATRNLVKDVDYYVCLPYIGASRSIGKMVYGGISFNTILISGTVSVSYQTLGGDWCADAAYVLERIAEKAYNPKLVIWDAITNKQNTFPPIAHQNELTDIKSIEDLIDMLNQLAIAIANGQNSGALAVLREQLRDDMRLLLTKSNVGLPDLVNLPLATTSDIADQVHANKYVTLAHVLDLVASINSAGIVLRTRSLTAGTYYLMKR